MSNCNTANTVSNSWARRGIVAIALGSMFFAACSADETSSPAEDTAPTESEAAAAESVLTEPSATAPATQPATTAPAATTPATTTPTTTTPAPPPATDPPATDPPAPNPPPSNDPPATDAPAPAPVFQSFSASNVSECAAPDVSIVIERAVTLSWEIEGADSVYVAIDNVNGPYETDLPAVGTLRVPVSCPEDSIFYVVAENAAGRTVMEATR